MICHALHNPDAYLPRHHTPEKTVSESVTEASISDEAGPLPSSITILLVEDELAVLKLTKILLQKTGYTVLEANHPQKALTIVQEHKGDIHLLLTDIMMPEINGLELSEIIDKKRPGIKKLFMSAYTAAIIDKHGILRKNTHFMEKPFTREVLESKVREALSS